MAATYTKVPDGVRSAMRVSQITSIVAGDRIDLRAVLGRHARQLKITTASTSDVIVYRLNSLVTRRKEHLDDPDETVEIWSAGAGHVQFSITGATEYLTAENLPVKSIEIVSLTGPASITIDAW